MDVVHKLMIQNVMPCSKNITLEIINQNFQFAAVLWAIYSCDFFKASSGRELEFFDPANPEENKQ